MLENNEITIENQSEASEQLRDFVNENKEETVSLIKYCIAEGDTLETVCENHNPDYESNIKIIVKLNGIENLDYICAGQAG